MAEQWLSIVEYSRAFNISDMTVRRRIKTGKLQAVLKDGKYFIPVPFSEAEGSQTSPAASAPGPAVHGGASRSQAPRSSGGGDEDMRLIKGHPAAATTHHRVYEEQQPPSASIAAQPQTQPQTHNGSNQAYAAPATPRETSAGGASGKSFIPESLSAPLAAQEQCLVDSKAFIAFCEASLKKASELERRQVEKFKSKLETLEATVQQKDAEVKQLRQQVEDLQLLVKILENKNSQKS